jgi:hypothetical protein
VKDKHDLHHHLSLMKLRPHPNVRDDKTTMSLLLALALT